MSQLPANCHIWSIVDFGKGPVEIRCTVVGEHDRHKCEVLIEVESPPIPVQDPDRRNIFEDRRRAS